MSLVLLGGGGFLGQRIMADRRAGERFKVVVRQLPAGVPAAHDGIEWHAANLLEADALIPIIERGDVVVNAAHGLEASAVTNLEMIDRVLDACVRQGARRLVHCSTAVVVGPAGGDVVTEATRPAPANAYQRIKLNVEERVLGAAGSLDVVVVRPTAIVGAGSKNLRSLADSLERRSPVANWLRAALFGDRPMHLVPVSRVAGAILHLVALPGVVGPRTFIVSADEDAGNNFADVERVLRRELGLPPRTVYVPYFPRPLLTLALMLLRRPETNLSRRYDWSALRATGFAPTDSVADGVREFAAARRVNDPIPSAITSVGSAQTTA